MDTPLGLLSGLWNALALSEGDLGRVRYLPEPGAPLAGMRGSVVLARLMSRLRAGDILLLHDGHAARTSSGTPVVLEVLPSLLEAIEQRGLRTVTLREALA